jgi:HEAT repeat protein
MDELVAAMQRLKSKTPIEAKTESQQLLDSISEHSGFLLPRGTDPDGRNMYGFLHQTFAEFLAACLLAGRWEDKELNLRDYAHDPYWREVLLLMAGHLGTQRRAKAGHFIEAVRGLKSCPYEGVIRRDLLLACEILGDGVPAGPPNVIESLLSELLSVWRETPIRSLRADVERAFQRLRGTEYAGVLARLATNRNLSAEDTVALAQILGASFFLEALMRVLKDPRVISSLRLAAAKLLHPIQQGIGDLVSDLDGNKATRFGVARVLIEGGDPRGITLLIDLLKVSTVPNPTILVGCKEPKAADAVAGLLESGDARLEARASGLLIQWDDKRGQAALPRLAMSSDPGVVFEVLAAMGNAKSGALDSDKLAAILQVPSLELRLAAAQQLAAQGDPRGVEGLADLLDAPDISVRLSAAVGLDERDDPRAIPVFVTLLSELDKGGVFFAIRCLAKHDAPEGLASLRRLITDADPITRAQAASQLLESGDTSAESILLEAMLGGGTVASIAFQALVTWGSVPLPELSAKLLSQPDVGLIWVVMQVLSRRKEAQAAEILTGLLDDERLFVRAHAAELLLAREEPGVLEALKCHVDRMLQETTLPTDPQYPVQALPPAESAYKFIHRHLTPAGVLPDWSSHG